VVAAWRGGVRACCPPTRSSLFPASRRTAGGIIVGSLGIHTKLDFMRGTALAAGLDWSTQSAPSVA
jgi:hypothetical protein